MQVCGEGVSRALIRGLDGPRKKVAQGNPREHTGKKTASFSLCPRFVAPRGDATQVFVSASVPLLPMELMSTSQY